MSGMDTLRAARFLEDAGLGKAQAEAIVQIISDHRRENLVTRDYLDMRLLQHTGAIAALFVAIGSLFAALSTLIN